MFILACFAGFFALIAFKPHNKSSGTNQNGWGIYVGKHVILCATKNDRGDTAYIDRKNIHPKDSLFVHEFICGGTIKPSTVNLVLIKDKAQPINIGLSYIRGIHFYPLHKLSELSDFENLVVEIHSSYNDYYYPSVDKNKPLATLIIV